MNPPLDLLHDRADSRGIDQIMVHRNPVGPLQADFVRQDHFEFGILIPHVTGKNCDRGPTLYGFELSGHARCPVVRSNRSVSERQHVEFSSVEKFADVAAPAMIGQIFDRARTFAGSKILIRSVDSE
jgi:hypothetical protein